MRRTQPAARSLSTNTPGVDWRAAARLAARADNYLSYSEFPWSPDACLVCSSDHLSFKAITSLDDLHSCHKFNVSANGSFVGSNLGVFMDDSPALHNGVSGMPARRLPCLVPKPEIPPLLAGPLQIWAKPQPNGSVAVFAVHMGQLESGAPHDNQTVTVDFADVPWLKAQQPYSVRDLYAKAALPGTARGSYTLDAPLAPVSSRMLLFAPAGGAE